MRTMRCLGAFLLVALGSAMAPAKCGKDTYYWGKWDGKAMCQACPAGKKSGGCTNCKPDPEGTRCIQNCGAGTYHSESGCSSCAPGRFQGAVGMHDCHNCPAGMSQSKGGMHKCDACAKGRFQTNKGSISCQACRQCKSGKFGSTPGVGMDSADMCRCEMCPVGTASGNGYTTCTKCRKGSFAEDMGQGSCTTCPKGKYASQSGSSVCTACKHGWTTAAAGADESSDCNVEHIPRCPAGRTMVVVGMDESGVERHACVNCAAGKYGYMDDGYKHGGRCMDCQKYHYQPGTGRTDCMMCVGGTVNDAKTECVLPTRDPTSTPTAYPTEYPTPPPTFPTRQPTQGPTVVPGDCEVTKFGKWSTCSEQCGSGIQTMKRRVVVATQGTGKPCPPLTKERNCNTTPCPVHCKYEWTAWTQCTKSCGGGFKSKSLVVHKKAKHGGKDCPETYQEKVCNMQMCPTPEPTKAPTETVPTPYPTPNPTAYPTTAYPTAYPTRNPTKNPTVTPDPLDCKLSEWTKGACSVSCGGKGEAVWKRRVAHKAKFGGKECNSIDHKLINVVDCHTKPCAIDCVVSAWSKFSTCTASCGQGTKTRTRSVVRKAQHGGESCGYLSDMESCNAFWCPSDCKVGEWSSFSKCSKKCGGGLQMAYRAVKRDKSHGGRACPSLSITRSCNEASCKVHCEVSQWGDWSDCTKSCGKGEQARLREVTQESARGGRVCPHLKETAICNEDNCPVDCVMSQWKAWSGCSSTCGGGFQSRKRSITTKPAYQGKSCSFRRQSRVCNEKSCPVNCEVSAWGDWHSCVLSCTPKGGKSAFHRRHRSIEQPAAWGGKPCPVTHEKKQCSTQTCPRDCKMTEWTHWSECTKSCGVGGTKLRTRETYVFPEWGGKKCLHHDETEVCGVTGCPVNCKVSQWSNWSACSKSCDTGKKSRTRKITKQSKASGTVCPTLAESIECQTQPCPVDCKVSKWGAFTMCTKTCGGGYYHRTRQILTHPKNGGDACDSVKETKSCEAQACPNDCIVSEWSLWSPCSATCGGGTSERYRNIMSGMTHGGKDCPISHEEVKCNEDACPVDCIIGKWSRWSKCSKTCGGGMRSRKRAVTAAKNGGQGCPFTEQEESCLREVKCPEHCVVSKWDDWGLCSAKCGTGMQQKSRYARSAAAYGGKACPHLEDSRICNTQVCAHDCEYHLWSRFSPCSVTCGAVGIKTRHRKIESPPLGGGKACTNLVEREPCSEGPCPAHCVVSDWSKWSACSTTCGTHGSVSRTRQVRMKSAHGGSTCPALSEVQKCRNQKPCPEDCKITGWTSWSICDLSCGAGAVRSRSRTIQVVAKHGGKACPHTSEEKECNNFKCPRDCMMSDWGKWSPCTHTCGKGTRFRFRSMAIAAAYGGSECPHYQDTNKCGAPVCPVDCQVGDWQKWQKCSRTCGEGLRTRYRSIKVQPQGRGKMCPTLKNEVECHVAPCPIDCQMHHWTPYTKCSQTCGPGGRRFRTRQILIFPQHDGKECPEMHDSIECNLGPCPVHCELSEWGKAKACTKPCGGGVQIRTRKILKAAAHGGVCPTLKESVPCNTEKCPVDCVMHDWDKYTKCSAECGTGFQTRNRPIKIQPQHGGKACGETMSINFCNTHECAVDCHVTEWSDWSQCTKTCGKGTHQRSRAVIQEADNFGKKCPALSQEKECMDKKFCPVDCIIDENTDWSGCSATCGGGVSTRNKRIIQNGAHGGEECPPLFVLSEERLCNTPECPYDCKQTEWSPWSECDKECDGGEQKRFRHTENSPWHGGKACGASHESKKCNIHLCPVDCLLSEWYEWSACSVTCGDGVSTQTREIHVPSMNGGTKCGNIVNERLCRSKTVCPVHCEVSEWSDYGECSRSCGKYGGEKKRKRIVTKSHNKEGKQCPHLTEGTFCNAKPCPVDCEVFNWSPWSPCDAKCSGGKSFRTRAIMTNSAHGGKSCDPFKLEGKRACNTKPCRVDCVLSGWDAWSKCSNNCQTLSSGKANYGFKTHTRYLITKPSSTGLKCQSIYHMHRRSLPGSTVYRESVACSLSDCSKAPTPWPSPYPTTKPTKFPTKRPTTQFPTAAPTNAPTETPRLCKYGDQKTIVVESGKKVSSGSLWMGGMGPFKIELKAKLNAPVKPDIQHVDVYFGGKKKITLWANQAKNGWITEHAFVWNPLTAPSDLVLDYKFVFKNGAQKDISFPANPIATCIDTTEDCVLSQWSDYSTCSKSCAGGERTRVRTIKKHPTVYGKPCSPILKETSPCNIHICPWEKRIELESYDDVERKNCIVGGSLKGFLGRGYVRSKSLASGKPCEATIKINVPVAGRYKVLYRYETKHGLAHDIVHEAVDHSYTISLDFPKSDGVWTNAATTVDLFKGLNEITLKSKHRSLNLDSVKLIHMNLMKRCHGGDEHKLDWFKQGTDRDDVEMTDERRPGLVPKAFSGGVSGRFDFGSRGPWEIRFDVREPKFGGSKSQLYMSLNNVNVTLKSTHMADDKYHSYFIVIDGPSLQYKFHFDDSTANEDDHLVLMSGFATCQGCKHVTCDLETGPKTWEWHTNPGESKLARNSPPKYAHKMEWKRIRTGNNKHIDGAEPKDFHGRGLQRHTDKFGLKHYSHMTMRNPLDTRRVIVRHHDKEFGAYDKHGHRFANKVGQSTKSHQCAWSKHYNKCECTCQTKAEYAYSEMP